MKDVKNTVDVLMCYDWSAAVATPAGWEVWRKVEDDPKYCGGRGRGCRDAGRGAPIINIGVPGALSSSTWRSSAAQLGLGLLATSTSY